MADVKWIKVCTDIFDDEKMAYDNRICVICGEEKPLNEMSVLAELRGICGHDLGYVCKDCIKHIDELKYFKRIEESGENE